MVTRRTVLKSFGIAAAAAFLPKVAFASIPGEKRLVVLILRGGMDGLAACIPYGDRDYAAARQSLAFAAPGKPNGALPLDSFFGLHPSMPEMERLFRAKELIAFHAVALPQHTRSHFDAQDILENGTAAAHGKNDGWLNRALKLYGPAQSPIGIAIGQSTPLLLRGDTPVGSWSPAQLPRLDDDLLERLERLYEGDSEFKRLLQAGLASDAMADDALQNGAMQPNGKGLRQNARGNRFAPTAQVIGKFLSEKNGPRIAAVDLGGWDTHSAQGLGEGRLAANLAQVSSGLDALKQSLGRHWQDTAVLVLTEFGRTVQPNGTNGTDHGTAGVGFLAGGAVAGGKVITDWPGLSKSRLYEGRDLAPTLDIRCIIDAVLQDHLHLPANDIRQQVLPGVMPNKLTDGLFV